MRRAVGSRLLACVVALSSSAAAGQDRPVTQEDEAQYLRRLSEIVANTSFVWFDEKTPREDVEKFAASFRQSTVYPGLNGFSVPLGDEELAFAMQERSDKASAGVGPEGVDHGSYRVEANAFVYGFDADCGDELPYPKPGFQEIPAGVERVGGPIVGAFTNRVWIIDSGISASFDASELNVNRYKPATDTGLSRRCDRQNISGVDVVECYKDRANKDKIGHGTFIAGTIGAKDDADGLVGVAPGVELVPVQIFTRKRPIVDLEVAYKALEYVADPTNGAQAGDVVNVSWGAHWDPRRRSEPRKIETIIRQMADRGVRIAVAAGNIEGIQGSSGYVETISPARAGAYRAGGSGAVVTVSAFGTVDESGILTDIFWDGSVFGNGRIADNGTTGDETDDFQVGPPDFAAPGVDVLSLVSGGNVATCTGTSFAAAHIAGILVKGLPMDDGAVELDPSARIPGTADKLDKNNYDAKRKDRIGVLP